MPFCFSPERSNTRTPAGPTGGDRLLSGSSIRYLLAIYQLSDGGAAVRSVDLANLLGITRASVVKSLKKLTDEGLVCKKHYGSIRLTASGIQEASRIFTEYTLLSGYFTLCLGLSQEQSRRDALAVVCAVSKEGREAMIQSSLRMAAASCGCKLPEPPQ